MIAYNGFRRMARSMIVKMLMVAWSIKIDSVIASISERVGVSTSLVRSSGVARMGWIERRSATGVGSE